MRKKQVNRNLYKINPKLLKELTKLVNKEIAKEHRKDALYTLQNCREQTIFDFLFFALSGNGNLACTCLDFAVGKNGKYIETESFNRKKYGVKVYKKSWKLIKNK